MKCPWTYRIFIKIRASIARKGIQRMKNSTTLPVKEWDEAISGLKNLP